MLKKLTIVTFAILALAAFSACDDGGGEGAKGPDLNIGAEGGACQEDGTCDSGLACDTSKICVKFETTGCEPACSEGFECKDGACVNIPAPETKGFGDACASTDECGENLVCADNKCAWDPDFVIPFADPNLKQAVIDAIKTTNPAYSATDVKVADCQKLPKVKDTELVTLDASDKEITDVAGIQYCSNLQKLDLSSRFFPSKLTSLPAGIFTGLTNLQKLDLSGNQLTSLPAGVFTGLTSLQDLCLVGNQLTTLPDSIFTGLTSLQKLHLDSNNLTTLPDGVFAGLTSLLWLSLLNNQLTTLPAGIFTGLTSLQGLCLGDNQLTTLPAGIFNGLTNLQVLGLMNTGISNIAPLSGLTKLTYLNLLDDPLVSLAPLATLHDAGGLPKGSKLKINKYSISIINAKTINTLKNDGVNVISQ